MFAICSGSPSLERLFSMCTLKPMMPPLVTSECFYLARSAELQSSQIRVSEMVSSSGIVNIPAKDCMNRFLRHLQTAWCDRKYTARRQTECTTCPFDVAQFPLCPVTISSDELQCLGSVSQKPMELACNTGFFAGDCELHSKKTTPNLLVFLPVFHGSSSSLFRTT